jgi:alpha-glucosidase
MFDAVRFWLDMGVDGFRLDAIGTIYEDPQMPEQTVPMTLAQLRSAFTSAKTAEEQLEAENLWEELFKHQVDQPGVHELIKELRVVIDEYEDKVLVGETDDLTYHGSGEDELHMVFNFPLMRTERMLPTWIKQNQEIRLGELNKISPAAWPCNTLGNHDSPRVYNRFGDGKNDAQIARLTLALMLTLRGTPFLYNGEEIGMTDLLLEDIDQFRDMLGVWLYEASRTELGLSHQVALARAAELSRDKNRTPMQWSNTPNGGFSPDGAATWLPVHPNYAQGVNVEDQLNDPGSLLNFYKRIIALRKENPGLIEGEYVYIGDKRLEKEAGLQDHVLAFLRRSPQQSCLVVLNFSDHAHTVDLSDAVVVQMNTVSRSKLIFSSQVRQEQIDDLSRVNIAPFEVYIAQVR